MIETLIALSILVTALSILIGTPLVEKYLAASGIVATDQQKEGKPRLPTSGGIITLFSFTVGLMLFTGLQNIFLPELKFQADIILASVSSTLFITFVGLADDLNINLAKITGEKELEIKDIELRERPRLDKLFEYVTGSSEKDLDRTGLSPLVKIPMVLPAVLPLMAVGAGSQVITFPLIGAIDFGLIYPLFLLPGGIIFVSNALNIIAGVNGLETGLAAVMSAFLGFYTFQHGNFEAALISGFLTVTLLGFLIYNRYPSSILPGDSLTYFLGGSIFSIIIIGKAELFAAFLFVPWYLELLLKLRSGFKARSWGKLKDDGTLESFYDRIYSTTHIFMKLGLTEKNITRAMTGLYIIWCSAVYTFFYYYPIG
jgi:UDP-N-acetylglucosamine--dolichyl-phosphate N-acetylglucosaminephosphotransferase